MKQAYPPLDHENPLRKVNKLNLRLLKFVDELSNEPYNFV